MALTRQRQAFVEHYCQCWVGRTAAIRAGFAPQSAHARAWKLLHDPRVKGAIEARVAELRVSTDEVLLRLAEQARADLGVFFKISERWTDEPLPTQEILEETDGVDKDGHPITLYRVHQVCIDTAKLVDPQYSHLVKEFSDSPKYGLSLKLNDPQRALDLLGKHLGLFKDAGTEVNVNILDIEEWKQQREERRQALDAVDDPDALDDGDDECAPRDS